MSLQQYDRAFPPLTIPLHSFVGLGEDPQVLAIRAPALFGVRVYAFSALGASDQLTAYSFLPSQLIASTYPDVVRGVPRV